MLERLDVFQKPFTGISDICLDCKVEHPYGLYTSITRGSVIDQELDELFKKMKSGKVSKPIQDNYDRLKELIESERTEIRYKVIAEKCNCGVSSNVIQEALDKVHHINQ